MPPVSRTHVCLASSPSSKVPFPAAKQQNSKVSLPHGKRTVKELLSRNESPTKQESGAEFCSNAGGDVFSSQLSGVLSF